MTDGAFRKLLESTNEVSRRPDLPAPKAEGNEVDAAVAALKEWVGMDVDDAGIRAVLWGIAMEQKNSDVVKQAVQAIYAEHDAEMRSEFPEEGVEPKPEGGVPEATKEEPEGKKVEEDKKETEEK